MYCNWHGFSLYCHSWPSLYPASSRNHWWISCFLLLSPDAPSEFSTKDFGQPQPTIRLGFQVKSIAFLPNRPILFDKCYRYNASTRCKFTYENNHTNSIPLFYPQPDDQRVGQMFCWNPEILLKLKERSTRAWQIQVKILDMPLIGWMTLRIITWSLWDSVSWSIKWWWQYLHYFFFWWRLNIYIHIKVIS